MNEETTKLRDGFAEEKAAEILEAMEKAMNEKTPKQAASYGEPWMHAPTWDILQTSEGKCIIYDAHHMEEPYLSRAIQCVNACAGIADPEKAIQAAREALDDADTWICELLPAHSNGGKRLDSIRAALAQLNNA